MASLTTEAPFSIVSKSVDLDRQRIGVSGELDLVTAPLLLDAARAALALPGCRDLVIDLGGVTFMDASAIGTLVRIRRGCEHMGGRLSVFGAEGMVADVLSMTGFDEWVGPRRLRGSVARGVGSLLGRGFDGPSPRPTADPKLPDEAEDLDD